MAAYAARAADVLGPALVAAGGLALALLAIGLAGRWAPLVQLALGIVVAAYAVALLERGEVDSWAPLVGAALLAVGELAYTALEPPARRTWPFSVALVVAAGVVGSLLLGAAGAGQGRLAELVLGVAAAAAALAVIARLAATATRSSR